MDKLYSSRERLLSQQSRVERVSFEGDSKFGGLRTSFWIVGMESFPTRNENSVNYRNCNNTPPKCTCWRAHGLCPMVAVECAWRTRRIMSLELKHVETPRCFESVLICCIFSDGMPDHSLQAGHFLVGNLLQAG